MVLFTVFVVALQDLNSQDQTVFVEVSINLWWRDPKAIGKGDDEPDELFNPAIEIQGAVEMELLEGDKGGVCISCLFDLDRLELIRNV